MVEPTNIIIVHDRKSHFASYLKERLVRDGFEVFLLADDIMGNRKVFCHMGAKRTRLEIEVKNGITVLGDSIALVIFLSTQPWGYQSRDKNKNSYEQMAWIAFWLFGQQLIGRVVNKVNHKMLSVSSLCLPKVYKEMRKVGIQVPKWKFDSQEDTKEKEEGFRRHIWQACDFLSQSTEGGLLIGRQDGQWVVCLYVFGEVFTKSMGANNAVKLSGNMATKIKSLCKNLGFDMLELLFLCVDKNWIGYGVSTQPDLDKRWRSHWARVASILSKSIERTGSDKKEYSKDCFIKKDFLPLVE